MFGSMKCKESFSKNQLPQKENLHNRVQIHIFIHFYMTVTLWPVLIVFSCLHGFLPGFQHELLVRLFPCLLPFGRWLPSLVKFHFISHFSDVRCCLACSSYLTTNNCKCSLYFQHVFKFYFLSCSSRIRYCLAYLFND